MKVADRIFKVFLFFALCAAFFLPGAAYAGKSAVPAASRVAVVVSDGFSMAGDVNISVESKFARLAESIVRRELRRAGFSNIAAVNLTKNQLKLLTGGDAKSMAGLAKKQQVQYLIYGNITESGADVNSFGTFSSTASVTLQIVSAATGDYVFDDMVPGKAVGGTKEEAMRKAIEKASVGIAALISGKSEY